MLKILPFLFLLGLFNCGSSNVSGKIDDIDTSELNYGKTDFLNEVLPQENQEDILTDENSDHENDISDSTDTNTCTLPLPDSPLEDWQHTTTEYLVITQGAPNHRGQDVVVNPGNDQILIGKFAYGVIDKDLKDEWVEVFVLKDKCSVWKKLGEDLTSEDGEFGTEYGIEDDGGRIFFTIPKEDLLPEGVWQIVMRVKGDHSEAMFYLYVVSKDTQAVVFDIDGTLTIDDNQILLQIADSQYDPIMYEDADKAAALYRQKHYLLFYLTGRPDMFDSITRTWLDEKAFPRGIVHLTDTIAQALPSESGVGQYKTDFLNKMQATSIQFFSAYGNATTDIQAYHASNIDKSRIFIIGDHGGENETQKIENYTDHLSTIQTFPKGNWKF